MKEAEKSLGHFSVTKKDQNKILKAKNELLTKLSNSMTESTKLYVRSKDLEKEKESLSQKILDLFFKLEQKELEVKSTGEAVITKY